MSTSGTVFNALSNFLIETPVFLVWLAGLVVAVTRWQRHPRVSLLTLIAIITLLLNTWIGTILNVQIPTMLSQWGWSVGEMGTFFMIKGFIQAVVAAVGYGLLLFALFGWRTAVN